MGFCGFLLPAKVFLAWSPTNSNKQINKHTLLHFPYHHLPLDHRSHGYPCWEGIHCSWQQSGSSFRGAIWLCVSHSICTIECLDFRKYAKQYSLVQPVNKNVIFMVFIPGDILSKSSSWICVLCSELSWWWSDSPWSSKRSFHFYQENQVQIECICLSGRSIAC